MSWLHTLHKLRAIARAICVERRFAARERWPRAKLLSQQQRALDELVHYAVLHCPFYQRLYQEVDLTAPINLASLPITTKEMVMGQLDEVLTPEELSAEEVHSHVEKAKVEYLKGSYRPLRTAGTSGLKGICVYSIGEWGIVLAAILRWHRIMGVRPKLFRTIRFANVCAANALHGSYQGASSSERICYDVRTFDAMDPVPQLVNALNEFQPLVLNSYPSIAAILAHEQLKGRLKIRPKVVCTVGEMRTAGMTEKIRRAWGVEPFDMYASSEVMVIGVDCRHHQGIHIFEDALILEVVDEEHRPVPPGTLGNSLLLTNLFNYTQPLIRYEISDQLSVTDAPCRCGLPFARIEQIDGRSDDILILPGRNGQDEVQVHPLSLRDPVLHFTDIKRYAYIQEADGIHIHLQLAAEAQPDIDRKLMDMLRQNLTALGAETPKLYIHHDSELFQDHSQMSKFKLVQRRI